MATGVLFWCALLVVHGTQGRTMPEKQLFTGVQKDELIGSVAAMWSYFTTFADQTNHYLPPDNVQETPVFRVAHRTSPTNICLLYTSRCV